MKTIRVVAAVIKSKNNDETPIIFATPRGYGDFKGGWEFPGGKIETGETPQEALKREIMEELDTEVVVGDLIDTIEYDYPSFHLSMDCFWCKVINGNLVLKEHEAAQWLTKEQLDDVDWLPADITSVKECGLYDAVCNGDYQFYDRDKVETPKEKAEIALKAFSSDYFLGSVNAMSEDGVFINIDGNANRVAAYAYGPKHVLLIVGMNKIVKSEEDALHRARNEAAPINAQRFGIDTPCSKNGSCFDCKSPQCICCQILTTRFSRVKGRFQIILVDENLGF